MDLTEANIVNLANRLQQTLNPDQEVRQKAEKFLEFVEGNKNYPILLLLLVDKGTVDMNIRIAGAITFKNYTKRNWRVPEEQVDKINADDRQNIKNLIVGLMLKSPEHIQRQLSDAVSIIGKEDFPDKWPNLLPEMISHFQTGDFHAINGVLHTAHSLFKRYRYEFKSQSLWLEIKFVLETFAKPLTDLFVATVSLAETSSDNPAILKVVFSSLVLIAKVFYSLNFQDIPEFFEDNMVVWMPNFLKLLTTDNKLLQTAENEDAGLLEQLKSQICENISLYAQKYDEEFSNYLPLFLTAVCSLLTNTGQQIKYDLLVSNAIHFLSSVAERNNYKHLFKEADVLGSICEKIIIPNMEFRECDEELFAENPEEYIRRDIEGSDIDTRRRAACDLVKALVKHFEAQITSVFSQYITVMLENYVKDPSSYWKSKDAAIYLVTSMTAKGQTAKHGIAKTNELVNVCDFFWDHILSSLQSPNIDEFPVLKADSLKYFVVFRNQLGEDLILATLPLVIKLLSAKSTVVHTYAVHAVERIFTSKDESPTGCCFKATDLQPIGDELLKKLISLLDHPGSSENEYIMTDDILVDISEFDREEKENLKLVFEKNLKKDRPKALEAIARMASLNLQAIHIQRFYRDFKVRQLAQKQLEAAIVIQHWFRGRRVRLWFLRLKKNTCLFQGAARALLEKKRQAAVCIQSCVRSWLLRKRLQKQQIAATKMQAIWRAYKVRCIRNKHVAAARIRIQQVTAAASPDQILASRTATALDYLLKNHNMSQLLCALKNLDTTTRLSPVCCEQLAESGGIDFIMKLIKSCNRSVPHMEVIKFSVNVLLNVAKYEKTVSSVWEVTGSLEVIIDMMRIFREKGCLVFTKCCSLLWILCQEPHRCEAIKGKKVTEQIISLHYLVMRKKTIDDKHLVKKIKMAKGLGSSCFHSTLAPRAKRSRQIQPDWVLGETVMRDFADPVTAISAVMKVLGLKEK